MPFLSGASGHEVLNHSITDLKAVPVHCALGVAMGFYVVVNPSLQEKTFVVSGVYGTVYVVLRR